MLTPAEDLGVRDIAVENGLVVAVGKGLRGDKVVDCESLTASPGFIDTHIHGYKGVDFTEADADGILRVAGELVKHGVTSFLASTVAAPREALLRACSAVKEAASRWRPELGARILGIHLEGPFLNPKWRGAMNEAFFRKPSLEELSEYVRVSGGLVRQVTVAPELEGALDFIREVAGWGIAVSLGHSDATYEQAVAAVEAGARKANHIFNGMRGFHHREPGLAFALLERPEVFVEAIVDFVHLHPATVRLVVDRAGSGRVVLVTDAVQAAGLPDGEYTLGGLRIVVKGGVSKLADRDTIAGSTLTMDTAVRNLVKLGYGLRDVLTMASLTPARSVLAVGRDRVGALEPGFRADFVLLDEELRVEKTIVNGEVVYGA
ncbi:MAG: N-acetylglucosamine-6-phosphate deacetylase [Thermofilum sp.]